jgi:hypothetical protein
MDSELHEAATIGNGGLAVTKKIDPLSEMMEKAGMTILQDLLGKDRLEARAWEALKDTRLVWALYNIRKTGRVDLPVKTVRQLVALGLAGTDKQGFFLTDTVEDLLDVLEKKLEDPRATSGSN